MPERARARPSALCPALDANWHDMNRIIEPVRVRHGGDMSRWITLFFGSFREGRKKTCLQMGLITIALEHIFYDISPKVLGLIKLS